MALRRTVASIGTKKLFPIKRITDRVKILSTSAIMAKLSLSPLCVQADTRRFALEPFKTRLDLLLDTNLNSDFCPTIEIFALEFDRVSR